MMSFAEAQTEAEGQPKLKLYFASMYKRLAAQRKLLKFGFYTHITVIWPMEQSSIWYMFDCPVSRQNISLLVSARDNETCLLLRTRGSV